LNTQQITDAFEKITPTSCSATKARHAEVNINLGAKCGGVVGPTT